MYDTIIIGAGTAGLTAAIYTARAGKSVLVYECETIGGQIAFSPKVENYPGVRSVSGLEFSDSLFEQATSFGAELDFDKVTDIIDNGDYKTVICENGKNDCKKVIIAVGVEHKKLNLPNENIHGVSYCALCDGAFYKSKDVAVVGGGNSALRSVQSLAALCNHVYLIHRRDEFRGEKMLADELKNTSNVSFILNTEIKTINGENQLESLTLTNKNGEETNLSVDGLFVCIGRTPKKEAFFGKLKLDEKGYIIAGEDCKTSVNGIFAAGDCRTKEIRQLTTAAADGAVAALA